MKIAFFLFLTFGSLLTARSQGYDRPPIRPLDIEKCMNDTNLFRATMLDNNFRYIGKIENGEEWQVPLENGDNGYVDPTTSNAKMALKISGKTEWVQSPKIVFMRSVTGLNGKIQKSIFVQIRKDQLPNYKKLFENMIRKAYPTKTVIPVTYSFGTANEKDGFTLKYSRVGSSLTVEMTDSPNDNWFLVYFRMEGLK